MKRVRDFHNQSWDNPFFERSGAGSRSSSTLFSLGLAFSAAAIVYAFIYSPLLRLNKIIVNGTTPANAVRIRAAATVATAGYDYFVVPKDHAFMIDTIGVRNLIMAQFPNLISVDVKKKFGHLDITVTERQPTYRLIIGDSSYLLDQEGKGLREAAPGEGDALIALSSDSADFGAGKSMIQPEWLQTIIDLHKYFATQVGIRDQLFKLDTINSDIEVVTVEGWSAIFDPQSDIKPQLQTLSSALAGKFSPDERKKLLYIDARFGDKIFYKSN